MSQPCFFRTAMSLVGVFSLGCGSPPPPSVLPNARAALARLHASQDCGVGLQAAAKIDHFGPRGRVRGDLLMFAVWPNLVRMDIVGPMNVGVVSTLTSNGEAFSLLDTREKRFLFGPASACNLARVTHVPMPAHVLVSLLRGEAPVLQHDAGAARIAWSRAGHYVVSLPSARGAYEEIRIAPRPSDWNKPWQEQQMRLVEVEVRQKNVVLYHATLSGHRASAMAKPRVDTDGIDADIPVSGPYCTAELPRTIEVEVPSTKADVQFRYESATWNPPLTTGIFDPSAAAAAGGFRAERVTCDE